MSNAEVALQFSGIFEAELLVELMLRYWKHPLATDQEYRNNLLEGAAEALRAAISGQKLIEDLPPKEMNLIAAIWYVEWCMVVTPPLKGDSHELEARNHWLESVRRALPSCFCEATLLGGEELP